MDQSARLRSFIEEHGTQAQFAERMGLRRETVSRTLTGGEPISYVFKARFLERFGLTAFVEVFGASDLKPSAEASA